MRQRRLSFAKGFISGLLTVVVVAICYGMSISFGLIAPDATYKFTEINQLIDKYYIGEYDTKVMEDIAYKSYMYAMGDPYGAYLNLEMLDDLLQRSDGAYIGIGVTIAEEENNFLITSVFEDSPGDKAGIEPGDKIIDVAGESVSGKTLDDVVDLMKGEAGTDVALRLQREGEEIQLVSARETIKTSSVSFEELENQIGYIQLTTFDRGTAEQFSEALRKMPEIRGLILDLRGNPGGLLDSVADVSELVVPKGVLTYTENKAGERQYYTTSGTGLDIPLVVLVDKESASASEVLIGAIKDRKLGIIVGEQTFGKGIVQNVYRLTDGTAVKFTIAKYYTPEGYCIDGLGISPDVEVVGDQQLPTAVKILSTLLN